MDTRHLLQSRREELLRAARRHHARNVRVFGSVARGDDRPDSDIDLLVEFDPEASLLDLVALQQDVEALLGRRADVVSTDGLNPMLRERILAEAKAL